jgi:lipoprotein NlpI
MVLPLKIAHMHVRRELSVTNRAKFGDHHPRECERQLAKPAKPTMTPRDGVLFRYLASSRAGQNASAELEANAGRLVTKAWPYAVIDLHLGRHSPEVTREAAGNNRCEADFHIGEWHLIRGERAEARTLLRAVADTCSKDSIEYGIALAELKRLQP